MSTNVALNTTQNVTAAYGVLRSAGVWAALGTGFNGVVDCIAVDAHGRIWFGGDFTTANGVTVNRITYWDGTTFVAIGGATKGADGRVRAIAVDPNGEDIVFCGEFANVGGGAATRIARYDFSAGTFSAYGSGLNGTGRALLFTRAGTLIVGGDFTTANGVTVNRLTYWTGATFGAYVYGGTTGVNGAVYALAETAAGYLLVGGAFTTAGSITVNRICYWRSTTAVVAIGDTPGVNGTVYALCVTPADEWFLGGAFTTADGTTVNYIASATINGFGVLTTGLNNTIYALRYNAYDRRLWVGGDFTLIGSNTAAAYIATWSGTAWSHVDIDLPAGFTVTAIHFAGERVYLGGDASGTATSSMATTLTGLATAGSQPTFVIGRAGGTSAVIEAIINVTYKKRLFLRYALADGETVTINLETRRMVSSAFGEVLGNIFADSNLATWRVEPGANVVTAYVAQVGAPTVTAYAQWQDYYQSVDGAAA